MQQAVDLMSLKQRVLSSGVGEHGSFAAEIAGMHHDYDLTVEPLSDAGGKRIGVTVAMMEITALKEAEATLKEADRRKDEFLATLAHELRNPLAPIRNAIHILHLKGSDTPELIWARDVIDRQTQQMTRLVDDLLDLSRITTGKLALRINRIELEAIVQVAIETSRPLIEENGHNLTVNLPIQPVVLNGDATRLAQIFANLLNNAAKYTEPGGQIELTAERQNTEVVVSVKDSGIGIPADALPYVFEMFTQGNRHLAKSHGGLGIGLTLVKRLVELHNGSIKARSAGPGKGSEFIVELPLVADRQPAAAENEGPVSNVFGPRLRILVVDDNKDNADGLGKLLQIMGHDLRTAYDGQSAIEIAEAFRADVILLDIGMPNLDGYDTCRHIRDQPWGKNMILIAQTGWGQDDDRRRTHAAGFDYHVVKPVDPTALMGLLAQSTSSLKVASNAECRVETDLNGVPER